MIKKNQFALIFLTVVTLLAVWYIKTPVEANQGNDIEVDANPVTTTGRIAALTSMREAVRNERSIVVASCDAVIANAESSLNEKEVALNQKKSLSALTEKEVLLELQVINQGYQDAFVHATNNGIEVLVVSDDNSATKANEIIQLALSSFTEYESVVVNFTPISDLNQA